MKNTELGRKVIDIIDSHPEQFDMGTFGKRNECGTVACLAGHAMLLSGYRLNGFENFTRPDGTRVYSNADEARHLLGLEWDEEFRGGNDDQGYSTSVWFDQERGPARFRKLVEESEGQQ